MPLDVEKSVCLYFQVLHLKSYHHTISIQDCIFTSDGSESICATLEMNSFSVQIVISNITFGEQVNDITLTMDTKSPYTVKIRDSLLKSNGPLILCSHRTHRHWL